MKYFLLDKESGEMLAWKHSFHENNTLIQKNIQGWLSDDDLYKMVAWWLV